MSECSTTKEVSLVEGIAFVHYMMTGKILKVNDLQDLVEVMRAEQFVDDRIGLLFE